MSTDPSAPSPGSAGDAALTRRPRLEDAASVWALVQGSGALDPNSPYAYLLLCSDFADTCLVAEADGRTIGFVAAYRPPPRPESVFVWQIVTASEVRGGGLGTRLLEALLALPACRDVRFLEATVTPSNEGSRALFGGFARRRGLPLVELPAFGPELFPAADHEEEIRVRIGPFGSLATHPEER